MEAIQLPENWQTDTNEEVMWWDGRTRHLLPIQLNTQREIQDVLVLWNLLPLMFSCSVFIFKADNRLRSAATFLCHSGKGESLKGRVTSKVVVGWPTGSLTQGGPGWPRVTHGGHWSWYPPLGDPNLPPPAAIHYPRPPSPEAPFTRPSSPLSHLHSSSPIPTHSCYAPLRRPSENWPKVARQQKSICTITDLFILALFL